MRNELIAAAALLAITGLAGGVRADDKITLRPKFVPGKYVHTATVKTVGRGAPAAGENKAETTSVWSLAVDPPDEKGNKKAAFQYRRFIDSSELRGKGFSNDSDKPAGDDPDSRILAMIYGPLLKASASVLIGPDEHVKEVRGLDALWDSQDKTQPVFAEAKKSFGDAQVKQTLEELSEFFPARAVGVGDEWAVDTSVTLPSGDQLDVKTVMKLAALDDGGKVAVIQISGKAESGQPPDLPPVQPGEKPIKPAKPAAGRGSVVIAGTLRVNVANPVLTDSSVATTMTSTTDQAVTTTTGTIIQKTQLVPGGEPVRHLRPSPFTTSPDEPKAPGK